MCCCECFAKGLLIYNLNYTIIVIAFSTEYYSTYPLNYATYVHAIVQTRLIYYDINDGFFDRYSIGGSS